LLSRWKRGNFGEKAAKEIRKIPLSNDSIALRITMMDADLHQQLLEKVKRRKFSLHLNE
jgi:hypothetical protein